MIAMQGPIGRNVSASSPQKLQFLDSYNKLNRTLSSNFPKRICLNLPFTASH